MKNLTNMQPFIVTVGTDKNPSSEAFNVVLNRFESMPENQSDCDFHFHTEDDANAKMHELGIVNYSIEEVYL